jgi:hypothetical protein
MDFEVAGTAKRAGVLSIAVALAACTTYVPLSQDYDGPDVLPADAPEILTASSAQSFRMTGLSETRERARFVVHELQLPSVADPKSDGFFAKSGQNNFMLRFYLCGKY